MKPAYGATPLEHEELDALLPEVAAIVGPEPSKANVYLLEQLALEQTEDDLLAAVLAGDLSLEDLLSDHMLRAIHADMYADLWTWAGAYRRRELNLGVAPELIPMEVRASMDNLLYRWRETDDWYPATLGIAVHAEMVRIHPFTDGNGRATRLLADLVLAAATLEQDEGGVAVPLQFDWAVDRVRYIDLLREYDAHRNPVPLANLIRTRPLD